jgi:hypothetical protein
LNVNCEKCGEHIFEAIPKKTTKQEIMIFAESAPYYKGTDVAKNGWIHPGSYCPNGCTQILKNYGSGDLFSKLDEKFENTHTVKVLVHSSQLDTNQYKIYIDGNIHRTRVKDKAPEGSVLVWLEPGEHRIVVRESEVNKANRLESQTIIFSANDGRVLSFELVLKDKNLELVQC